MLIETTPGYGRHLGAGSVKTGTILGMPPGPHPLEFFARGMSTFSNS